MKTQNLRDALRDCVRIEKDILRDSLKNLADHKILNLSAPRKERLAVESKKLTGRLQSAAEFTRYRSMTTWVDLETVEDLILFCHSEGLSANWEVVSGVFHLYVSWED